jgi:hypothetical protein
VRSLRKLSKGRLVIVSFSHCNQEYEKSLLPVFDKRIEITNDVDNSKLFRMILYNQSFRSREPSSCVTLRKETLTLVPSR